MPSLDTLPPRLTALLFGMSGRRVDLGACSLPATLQRCHPSGPSAAIKESERTPGPLDVNDIPREKTATGAGFKAIGPRICHGDFRHSGVTQGTSELARSNNPKSWSPLVDLDACCEVLIAFGANTMEGSMLFSGKPRLLQADLKAGPWAVGLAACGPFCGKTIEDRQSH